MKMVTQRYVVHTLTHVAYITRVLDSALSNSFLQLGIPCTNPLWQSRILELMDICNTFCYLFHYKKYWDINIGVHHMHTRT